MFDNANVIVQEDSKRIKSEKAYVKEKETGSSTFSPYWYWIICGVGAGVFMGTGATIYAVKYAKYGLAGTGVLGPGMFIIFLIARIIL